jgi:hypothetical protein
MPALFQQTIMGMSLKTLAVSLARNRGRVYWRCLPRLAFLSVLAAFN